MPPLATGLFLASVRPRLAVPLLAAAGAVTVFFRDPPRDPATPRDPDLVYAPADGRITTVTRTDGPGGELVISAYLSLTGVHVTRSPVTGTLAKWENRHGRTGLARDPRSAVRNRQARLTIDAGGGTSIRVDLIAGAAARRISAWVRPGDRLEPGRKLGIIHFGSRTTVTLPADVYGPLVLPGDRVTAGITPIAWHRPRQLHRHDLRDRKCRVTPAAAAGNVTPAGAYRKTA